MSDSKSEALALLKKLGLKRKATVYTCITHVSRSGMSRNVRCFTVIKGQLHDITGMVAHACGFRRATGERWDIRIGGCGFDAGFEIVSALAFHLFQDSYALNHARL